MIETRTPHTLPYTVRGGAFLPVFQWSPHEGAPLFAQESDPAAVVGQFVREIQSGNYPTTERYRDLFRQASLVSLFFFMKMVLGYDGPYDEPNYTLHLDMANFIQKMQVPGRKAAVFMPRSSLKSTEATKAQIAWRLLREPNARLGIGSSIAERAQEFRDAIKVAWERNEVLHWLFPERKPAEQQPRWTQKDLVIPGRTKNLPEPSIKVFAIGGSTAGIHVDGLFLDDIVDDSQLDSGRLSSADMVRTGNWLKANIPSLVISWMYSTVFMVGTRYAPDDPYEWMLQDLAHKYGYWEDLTYEETPTGAWHVYYRQALEYGDVCYPARYTKMELAKLLENDPWTYWRQYINNAHKGSNAELHGYRVGRCFVDWQEELQDWVLTLETADRRRDKQWRLSDCDVIQAADPSASEIRSTSRTSRAAHGVIVTTPDEEYAIVDGHCEYAAPTTTLFDWLFAAASRFPTLRATALETQGPFKLLSPELWRQQEERKRWLGLISVTSPGNKDANIRHKLQPVLHRQQLYCCPELMDACMDELRSFPHGHKKDFLDMVAIGLREARVPPSEADLAADEELIEMMSVPVGAGGKNQYTGY